MASLSELLDAIRQVESGGNRYAVSPAGAMGPYQFMPATAKEFGLSGDDVYDENKARDAAARKMQGLLDQYGGNLSNALAAYNLGQGNMAKFNNDYTKVPETRDYVSKVLKALNPISEAQAAEEWTPEELSHMENTEQEVNNAPEWTPEELSQYTQESSTAGMTPRQKLAFRKEEAMKLSDSIQMERGPISNLTSGIGGELLNAAGNAVDFVAPGYGKQLKQAGEQGINDAEGFMGGAGKLVGGALPYVYMPQRAIPAILASGGIGALTSEGDDLQRLKGGLISAAGQGVGEYIGPVLKAAGRGIGTVIGELGTHTGGETIKDAARAGMVGGEKLNALLDFMRNNRPLNDIVYAAKTGLSGLSKVKSNQYNTAMNALKQDKTVLPYSGIEEALNRASKIGTYEGHVVNPAAVNVSNKLKPIIEEWSGQPYAAGKPFLDPASGALIEPMNTPFPKEFAHTIEGLDQLKKRVGVEYKSTPPGTPERLIAKDVYNSVKKEIENQNATYKDIMKKSQDWIKLRKELNKELSLNENLTDSTALRKLLAVPRNNANTNYGNRVELARLLEEYGAKNLMTMLNGAALSSSKPRGLGGIIGGGSATGAGVAALTGNPGLALGLSGILATQSPRLMGETAVKAGQAYRILAPLKPYLTPALISVMQQ